MGGFHGLIGSPLVFFIPIKSKTVPPGTLTRAQIRSSHDPCTSLRLKKRKRAGLKIGHYNPSASEGGRYKNKNSQAAKCCYIWIGSCRWRARYQQGACPEWGKRVREHGTSSSGRNESISYSTLLFLPGMAMMRVRCMELAAVPKKGKLRRRRYQEKSRA